MANVKDREYFDHSEMVRPGGRVERIAAVRGVELVGCIGTIHGFVAVSSTNDSYANGEKYRVTMLEFIHGGRKWRRHYSDFFQKRTLVTLAKQFAHDVVVEKGAEDGQPEQ